MTPGWRSRFQEAQALHRHITVLSLSEALFSASDVIDGVKSLVGKARSTIRLESRSDGAVSLKGTVDLSSASFAQTGFIPGLENSAETVQLI